ncbi:MAG: hypothetical protein NTZ63_06950 [Candidatus Omnitrophica bacterium]|nr:hypothetical protein [Candidatus Omnitrophota bacterium]
MFKEKHKNIKSQALLDFIVVFGILIAFLVGLVHIWIWFNANYAKRNVDYQWTREAAGTANDSIHSSVAGIYSDKTIPIDDKWVFKGGYSGEKIPLPPGATASGGSQDGIDAAAQACATARASAATLRDQATNYENTAATLNLNCDDDDDGCEGSQNDARVTLRSQAANARTEATRIENEGCL